MFKRLILATLIFLSLIASSFILAHCAPREIPLKEADYYQKLDDKQVQCVLCPRRCIIPDGKRGYCGVRENKGGILYTLVYAKPVAVHVDPIEKKPLFNFLPGSPTFSIATAGCNLKCKFCQNWQISQSLPEEADYQYLPPELLVQKAEELGIPIIAYTYTEPTIFYEYMFDSAKLAREKGIKNMMHSAGYINEKPLRELCKYLDGACIDLKGFSNEFYNEMCLGRVDDVLRTLKILKEEGVWLEIVNLIIPGKNDSPEEIRKMCEWIKENLGLRVPLHFSRFWPMHKLINLSPTPVSKLEEAYKIARDVGLYYVYIGNVPGNIGEITYCPESGEVAIRRIGYKVVENHVNKNGICEPCGEKIDGVWK